MKLSDAWEFIKQQQTCVLATIDIDGLPQAATVGVSVDDNFRLLIGTNKASRKYQNLKNNPVIALVVGFEGSKTLQLQGAADEVRPSEGRIKLHFEQVPGAKKFASQEGQAYFEIVPNWLKFTDYTNTNPIFETRDF